jgi:NAD(P)-dependent dehydrogenase (short-subunit alcohol dehydrogenase family)
MGLLEGKVAIVTGAGRGIGRGEAIELAKEGAKVVVNDLGGEWDGSGADQRPAQQVVDEIVAAGGTAVANYDDVADWAGSKAMVDQAIETYGSLDILVCNAGILRDKMVFNMEESDWDAVMRVHLKGHFAPTRHACAYWRQKAKESGGSANGRVIGTSSTSGLLGNIGQSNYGAAKAGIAAFMQIVSMEMGRYGVTANAIAPAARTRMTERTFGDIASSGDFDLWDPDNVAPLVAYLGSDQAASITGQTFYVYGGNVHRFEPWSFEEPITQTRRWTASELVEAMPDLFKAAPTAYSPQTSSLQDSLQ